MTSPNPVLVKSTRNGWLEKSHRGSICIVNEKDEIVFSAGDAQQFIFPRSAMKYFQVLPLIESGAADEFGFTDEEIALMCASHNAEEIHLETTRNILKKAGLDEKYDTVNRRKITLHSFRAYFFTKAARVHDENYAHKLTGHGGPLSQVILFYKTLLILLRNTSFVLIG